jgi:hypothetical protein
MEESRPPQADAWTIPQANNSMLKLLRSLIPAAGRAQQAKDPDAEALAPPSEVSAPGVGNFFFDSHLSLEAGFPIPDWTAAQTWVETIPDEGEQASAWTRLERAWLAHLQLALGPAYHLHENKDSFVLSTLEPHVARATLDFMSKTLQRIVRILDGIAEVSPWGKDILIVLDDEDSYYRYVSHYYPEDGEFAASGGMYINAGCGHFVTVNSDLHAIEPIIAHEMTHSCLSHLPIPAWLNEGLAVNTEQRLVRSGMASLTPQQMHQKHCSFWGDAEMQEFWSGKSFLRNDDGNMLSYDLARILVSQLSADWSRFRSFVLEADFADGGAASAIEHLGMELGTVVNTLLGQESGLDRAPAPSKWKEVPERGAF